MRTCITCGDTKEDMKFFPNSDGSYSAECRRCKITRARNSNVVKHQAPKRQTPMSWDTRQLTLEVESLRHDMNEVQDTLDTISALLRLTKREDEEGPFVEINLGGLHTRRLRV